MLVAFIWSISPMPGGSSSFDDGYPAFHAAHGPHSLNPVNWRAAE